MWVWFAHLSGTLFLWICMEGTWLFYFNYLSLIPPIRHGRFYGKQLAKTSHSPGIVNQESRSIPSIHCSIHCPGFPRGLPPVFPRFFSHNDLRGTSYEGTKVPSYLVYKYQGTFVFWNWLWWGKNLNYRNLFISVRRTSNKRFSVFGDSREQNLQQNDNNWQQKKASNS